MVRLDAMVYEICGIWIWYKLDRIGLVGGWMIYGIGIGIGMIWINRDMDSWD